MPTMNEVIQYVDRVKPNAYSEEDKYKWLNTVEGMIVNEVMQDEGVDYNIPADADTPLLVDSPFSDIYELYVSAMIDFHNREYDHYNNTVLMFQERLDKFKAHYLRTHENTKARNFRNVMG